MNAKARQNNMGRIHGANPRYEIDIFPYQGPPIGGEILISLNEKVSIFNATLSATL